MPCELISPLVLGLAFAGRDELRYGGFTPQ